MSVPPDPIVTQATSSRSAEALASARTESGRARMRTIQDVWPNDAGLCRLTTRMMPSPRIRRNRRATVCSEIPKDLCHPAERHPAIQLEAVDDPEVDLVHDGGIRRWPATHGINLARRAA